MAKRNITFRAKRHPGKRATKPMLNVDRPDIRKELAELAHNHLFLADMYLKTYRADVTRKPADPDGRAFAAVHGKAVATALKASRQNLNRMKREARKAK